MVFSPKLTLDYMNETPKKITWRIVAGGELEDIQMYDIVFDEYDYKIRQLEMKKSVSNF